MENASLIQELQQKINDARSSSKTSEREYDNQCAKLGIKGENIIAELNGQIARLPEIIGEICSQIKDKQMRDLIDFYYKFCQFSLETEKEGQTKGYSLPILEYLHKHNDDLVELWKIRSNNDLFDEALLKQNEKRYEKYVQLGKEAAAQLPAATLAGDGIVWDIQIEEASVEPQQSEIKWDDFIVLEGDEKKKDATTTQATQATEAIPQGDTILAHLETRNLVIAELNEILFFLKHRLYEMKQTTGTSVFQVYDHSKSSSEMLDVAEAKLEGWIKTVTAVIASLSNFKVRALFSMKDNPKNKERIKSELQQFKVIAKKQNDQIIGFNRKISEIEESSRRARSALETQVEHTTSIKASIEAQLKTMFKRDILITGDIGKVLKL